MKILIFILAGFAGGVLGGMGMGGGTLLIPILTVFLDIDQKAAQAINLLAFLPMALVALSIHIKNKLVDKTRLAWIIVPAIFTSLPAAYLAVRSDAGHLRLYFGIFLIVLGTVSLAVYGYKAIYSIYIQRHCKSLPLKSTKSDKNP